MIAQVLVVEDCHGHGMLAGTQIRVEVLPIEGVQRLVHAVDGAVRSVVGQSATLLQLLPDGPDLVHEGVVHEEDGVVGDGVVGDGVVGGVLQRGQGVLLPPAYQVVDGVVGHLELNLKVAVVGLLQGQENIVEEHRVLPVVGQFAELGLMIADRVPVDGLDEASGKGVDDHLVAPGVVVGLGREEL